MQQQASFSTYFTKIYCKFIHILLVLTREMSTQESLELEGLQYANSDKVETPGRWGMRDVGMSIIQLVSCTKSAHNSQWSKRVFTSRKKMAVVIAYITI